MNLKSKQKKSGTNASYASSRVFPWLFLPIEKLWKLIVPEKLHYRLKQYALLMRIDRPIGTLLLLWPTLWALFLATSGTPSLFHLLIFTAGTFLMRSAGCVINDFADRDFDGHVSRTKKRPLAQRSVSPKEAILLFLVLSLAAFGLVLLLNTFTLILSFGALVIAAIYPFMKRVTYFPQVVLGAAFAWSIPMAFAATSDNIPVEAWLLYVATLLWVLAYDTYYAMVDRKDDVTIGVKSTAILFGDADLSIIGLVQGIFLFGMLLLGVRYELNWPYYLAIGVAFGLVIYQLWIARKRKPDQCFKAFLNNNYVGMSIFIGILFGR